MYAVKQDIVDRYGEDMLYSMTDRDSDQIMDPAAIDRALTDASAEIDSYVSRKYRVPLVPVPDVVKEKCVDIAVYRLADRPGAYTEERRKRYEDAIAWLKDVSDGKAALGNELAEAQTSGFGAVRHGQANSQFEWNGYP